TEVPASVFQSINAIYIVLLGPVFAGLWLWLGRRGWEPSAPAKFGLGVIQLGLGFLVLVAGATAAGTGNLTPVIYIFLIYLLHTMGELCLSPVGLSAMNRLAPAQLASIIMGTWFFASATGAEGAGPERVTEVYSTVGWTAVAVGVGMLVVSPLVRKLMHLDTLADDATTHALAGEGELAEPAAAGIRTETELKPGEVRS
ncbi:MAG TPA: MFS transporter, partial [Allosphingosinicella sp.]